MINQLRADLFAQRHSTGFWAALLFSCVSATVFAFLLLELAAGDLAYNLTNVVMGVSDVMVINLLGALLIGVTFSRSFETKSVHNALLAHGRGVFVASKTIVAAMSVFVLAVPYGVASLLARGAADGNDPNVSTPFAEIVSSQDSLGVWQSVGLALVVCLSFTAKVAVCMPLAIAVRRPIIVALVGFIWSFVADFLLTEVNKWNIGESFANFTPYGSDRQPLPSSSASELGASAIIGLVFIATMGFFAWLLFRRADVK